MNNDVESLVMLRRRLLRNSLIGYPIWLGAQILEQAMPHDGRHGWVNLIEVIGWAIWAIALWKFCLLQKTLRANPALASALSDELWWANRYKAAFFAFAVLFGSQALFALIFAYLPHLMTLSAYVDLDMIIGYAAFVGAFLHLDQQD